MKRKLKQHHYQFLGAAVLYALLATAMLAPMASNDVIPNAPDLDGHLGYIVQARMALEEGQFPIRVAPWQVQGGRFACFQYYSQLPHTLAGLIHLWLTPENPYVAAKLLYWAALWLGGLYTYRTARRLVRNVPAALLAGAVYLTAPYFLINIHARGALAEAVAQGLLPATVFYTLRCFARRGLAPVLSCGLAWFAQATTHVITFVYGSLFIGLLVIMLVVPRVRRWQRPVRVGAAYALAWALALYFLWPVATARHLEVARALGPPGAAWLTTLSALLSPVSVPAEPQPGLHKLPRAIHPAPGWPLLASAAVACWLWWSGPRPRMRSAALRRGLAICLLLLFGAALFMAWSPVNFWRLLPRTLWVAQYAYRLLAQVSWTGALLTALALVGLFRARLDARHVVVGVILCGLLSTSYLTSQPSSARAPALVRREPDTGYGTTGYVVAWRSCPDRVLHASVAVHEARCLDGWLWLNKPIRVPAWPLGTPPILRISGHVPAYLWRDGAALCVYVNDDPVARATIQPGPFDWEWPVALDAVRAGPWWLEFRAENAPSPQELDPQTSESRDLLVELAQVELLGPASHAGRLGLPETRAYFTVREAEVVGQICVPDDDYLVQLPVLYYPDVLDLRVDGAPTPYGLVAEHELPWVGLVLPAGTHEIAVRFVGVCWANRVSLVAWLGTAGLAVGLLARGTMAFCRSAGPTRC